MSKYQTPSREELIQKHVVEKQSRRDLEKFYGVTAPVISRWMKELGIEFIGRKDRARPDKEILEDLHITQRKTIQEISVLFNKAQRYVDEWFEFYQIPKQRYRKRRKLAVSAETLKSMHHSSQMTLAEIAQRLEVSDVMVGKWFDEFGIEKKQFFKQSNTSKAEIQISDYVRSLGFEPTKTRNVLPNRLELDVFVAEKSFAIEHCGLYWHSEQWLPPSYHATKLQFAKSAGVDLFTLFEDEWIEKRPIVESMISHKLGRSAHRVFARKCVVREISSKEAKQFFNRTHLQGAPGTIKLAIGLFLSDALVGCMSFGRHQRTGKEVILQRMSFELNTTVVGGASKMFNFARHCDFCRDQPVVTWSDERYSAGGVYAALGFKKCGMVPADYYYVKGQRRFPKQRFQKRFTGCPVDMTEREHAHLNGYLRLWDCGKTKWVNSVPQK